MAMQLTFPVEVALGATEFADIEPTAKVFLGAAIVRLAVSSAKVYMVSVLVPLKSRFEPLPLIMGSIARTQ